MHGLGAELWRIAKELRHSGAGDVLTLIASVLIVAGASWRVLAAAWRVVRACWTARGTAETGDGEFPEGA